MEEDITRCQWPIEDPVEIYGKASVEIVHG